MQGIVTGASRGLGLALMQALVERGWRLVVDARGDEALRRAVTGLDGVVALVGDVTDPDHRRRLVEAAGGPIDLLVNNASVLGPSPQPPLAHYPLDELRRVYEVNVIAPLALTQLALPHFGTDARVLNVTSDAAVEAYESWGGYGSSKAALAQITAVLGTEARGLRAYAVDPGDMRTQLQQEAFPGENISDRPLPEESVPGLLALIEGDLPSGLYRARDLIPGVGVSALAFDLPPRLEAHEPPEARGLKRDDVRLLVASRLDGSIVDSRFSELPQLVDPGDLIVLNTSATLPAALPATRADGTALELRLSTPAPGQDPTRVWVVELRQGDAPFAAVRVAEQLTLPAGATARILAPYAGPRLWLAGLDLPTPLEAYLSEHGHAIRYRHVPRSWPLSAYQNVFAVEPGSAEMPSAGRPFTPELITRLVAAGVLVAPITLHTGVSSQERGEHPYPERYRVPAETARLVNAVHEWGGRVVATGTTVVRALETVAQPDGTVAAGEGWTSLIVTPERGLWSIDGLLTGLHEPESSHLELLRAAAGDELLARSYRAALEYGYRWHEFGDTQLILGVREPSR